MGMSTSFINNFLSTLLMRSGVGPATELRPLGIDVVQDVPGVGQNLGDHPRVLLGITSSQPPKPPRRMTGFVTFACAIPLACLVQAATI